MSIAALFPAIIIPSVAGFLLAVFLAGRDGEAGLCEKICLGYGAGAGLLAFVMFISGVAGIPFGIPAITAPLLILSVVLIYLLYKGGKKEGLFKASGLPPLFAGLRGWRLYLSIAVSLWVFLKLSFVFYETMARPIFGWDAWTHWSTAAKIFFYNKGLLLDSSEYFFGRGYRFLGHPINVPLLEVWAAMWMNEFHEAYVKAWSFFYFAGILGIYYFAVKRESSAFFALIGVFFLSSVPILTFHGTEIYSDMPLGFYALASTVCFWRYMEKGDGRLLAFSGVFVSMCVTTKNEGLFFLAAVGFAVFLYLLFNGRLFSRDALFFLLPVFILAGPWLLFKLINGIGFGHTSFESETKWFSDPKFGPDAPRRVYWEVLPVLIKQFFFRGSLGLIFPFWTLLTAFYFRTVLKTEIKYLYVIALTVLSLFVFTYLVMEVTAVLENTGVQRNTLTYLPVIFFASSVLLSRAWVFKRSR